MSNIQHGQKRPRFPNKWLFLGAALINVVVFFIGVYIGDVVLP